MAERAGRAREAARAVVAPTPSERFDQLLESVAGLAREGSSEALVDVLREADRLIAREAERLEVDASSAPQLRVMQRHLQEMRGVLETEQQRIVRDLAALQASAQADSRYGPPRPSAIALDRRG